MIRQATEQDLTSIANVHIECFPDSFSTRLGKAKFFGGVLLTKFYKEYLEKVPELFLVAENDEKELQGFCMGYYCEDNNYMKNFFKNNFFGIGLRILWLLLTIDNTAWKKLKGTFKKSNPFEVLNHEVEAIQLTDKVDLLSICVLPQCRGNGMAQELINCYEDVLKEQKRKICILTVATDNGRGVHFYEKNGYIPYKEAKEQARTYSKYL